MFLFQSFLSYWSNVELIKLELIARQKQQFPVLHWNRNAIASIQTCLGLRWWEHDLPSGSWRRSVNDGQHGQSVTVHSVEWRRWAVRGARRLDRKWTASITRENSVRLRGRREIHASRRRYQHVAEFQWRIDRQIPRYVSAYLPLCGAGSDFCALLYFV